MYKHFSTTNNSSYYEVESHALLRIQMISAISIKESRKVWCTLIAIHVHIGSDSTESIFNICPTPGDRSSSDATSKTVLRQTRDPSHAPRIFDSRARIRTRIQVDSRKPRRPPPQRDRCSFVFTHHLMSGRLLSVEQCGLERCNSPWAWAALCNITRDVRKLLC